VPGEDNQPANVRATAPYTGEPRMGNGGRGAAPTGRCVARSRIAANGAASTADTKLEEAWSSCTDGNAATGLEGCTAVILANEEAGANLAAAFYNRGIAYRRKSEYELAIGDYGQAIRLDPGFAGAFNNRGIAQREPPQRQQAERRDHQRVIWLRKRDDADQRGRE